MKYKESKAWHFSHELALQVHELVREVVETDSVAMELAVKLRKSSATVPTALKVSVRKELVHEKLHYYQISRHSLEELHSYLEHARELNYIEKKLFKKLERLAIRAHNELSGLIKSADKALAKLQSEQRSPADGIEYNQS
jgi:four helix bundle protein